jgi:hypothetical protein
LLALRLQLGLGKGGRELIELLGGPFPESALERAQGRVERDPVGRLRLQGNHTWVQQKQREQDGAKPSCPPGETNLYCGFSHATGNQCNRC